MIISKEKWSENWIWQNAEWSRANEISQDKILTTINLAEKAHKPLANYSIGSKYQLVTFLKSHLGKKYIFVTEFTVHHKGKPLYDKKEDIV